jgi:Na+/H+-dicarboxylate symporter
MIGLVLGVGWSFLSAELGWNEFTLDWIDPFGQIFLRLLKMIAVPLVLFSIISGIISLGDSTRLGRLGFKTLVAYLITTFFAVGVGLTIVNIFTPGEKADLNKRIENRITYEIWAEENQVEINGESYLADPQYAEVVGKMRGESEADQQPNARVTELMKNATATKDAGPLQFIVDMVPDNVVGAMSDGKKMLQVIFFALFFGITLLILPDSKVATVKRFVEGCNEIFLKMVDVVMRAAPIFVFALLAGVIAKSSDSSEEVAETLFALSRYAIVLVVGLAFMVFIVYPTLVVLLVKDISYRQFFRAIGPAQLMAFSTSSSAATLPVTMDCVRENLGVSKEITSFVLPIGATVNMDGTSLYQAVAVIFLAQFHLVDLAIGEQLVIVLTATLASIGSAAVPSAGLVMMILVLGSVGLPGEWIAFIMTIDRPLDMCRTVVNVTGDATVTAYIASSEGELNFDPNKSMENFEVR